jgi:hypothetical protein
MLRLRRGQRAADSAFPIVAAHLTTGCPTCLEDLADASRVAEEEIAPSLSRIGINLVAGRLLPATARFRGPAVVSPPAPDRTSESSPRLDSLVDLFQRACGENDQDARDTIARQFHAIVTSWVPRDRAAQHTPVPLDEVMIIARAYSAFWSTIDEQPIESVDEVIQMLRQLRSTTEDAVRG